ncbi:universal stress protein [Halarchaeum salinum]|uniref:UspA domain-containing protein n=1 Tax=Halarchaeum salinum TaxID=489912 RepID=A0AAV3S5X3_9EURY
MALNEVLLAVRPGDEESGRKLAQTLVDIAQPADAHARIAIVLTEEEREAVLQSLGVDDLSDISTEELARRHGTFKNVIDTVEKADLEYELGLSIGPHAERIIELATDADLAIIGGADRSATGKAVFGSAAQDVLQSAPCPVVFVRRD